MKKIYLYIFAALLFSFTSCKEDPQPGSFAPPVAKAENATNITRSTATLNGSFKSSYSGNVVKCGFYFGTNSSLENASKIESDKSSSPFLYNLTGLSLNTTYYCRSYLSSGQFEVVSDIISFKTLDGTSPSIFTSDVSGIGVSLATCGGVIEDDGGGAVTGRGICWSTSENPTIELATKTKDGSGTGSFTSSITGLSGNTKYYVRSYATNSFGTQYGEQKSFTTVNGLIDIKQVSDSIPDDGTWAYVFKDEYRVRGRVISNATSATTPYQITIRDDSDITWGVKVIFSSETMPKSVIIGDEVEIKLLGSKAELKEKDVMKVYPASNETVSKTSAQNKPYSPVSVSYFSVMRDEYKNSYVKYAQKVKVTSTSKGQAFNSGNSGNKGFIEMTDGTNLFLMYTSSVESWAADIVPDGEGYISGVVDWSPSDSKIIIQPVTAEDVSELYTKPSSEVVSVSNITQTSADIKMEVTSSGGYEVTERGFYYGTSNNPENSGTKVVCGAGMGEYSHSLTGLASYTMYYVKAYAVNSLGTSYSDICKGFFTKPEESDYKSLSYEGTANCYRITESINTSAFYSFDATVIGNGQLGIIAGEGFHTTSATIAPQSARLLWQDKEGVITDVSLSSDKTKVLFTANVSSNPSYLAVNAVIAVYSSADCSGDVLWSWHIWGSQDFGDVTLTNFNGKTFVMMDANLGSVGIANMRDRYGLFYQWGRKDPFPSPAGTAENAPTPMFGAVTSITNIEPTAETGTIDYAVKHPDGFLISSTSEHWIFGNKGSLLLWGNGILTNQYSSLRKTIYDPCPAGYLVPPDDVWSGFTTTGTISYEPSEFNVSGSFTNGWSFYSAGISKGVRSFYPASGGYSGKYTYVGTWGYYWNSTAFAIPEDNNSSASEKKYFGYLSFASTCVRNNYSLYPFYANSIRCVKESSVQSPYPVLQLSDIKEISYTSAKVFAEFITEGTTAIAEKGFCWSTSPNPTILDSHQTVRIADDFILVLNNLTPNTTYYVRSYAKNSNGIGYSTQKSFITTDDDSQKDGDNEDVDIHDFFNW